MPPRRVKPNPNQLELAAPPEQPEVAEPKVYAVSEIVKLASRTIEQQFSDVWVEGEVSNFKRSMAGHLYFTLKDGGAQLPAVAFRSVAKSLRFDVENGQALRCRGRLTIYEAQGRFQFSVTHAEPAGLGALQLAFEQLKRKLQTEGLFDERYKKTLPRLPRQIAVVTSRSGAAVRDVLRVLETRCPVRVLIVPTAVQGTAAPAEICQALRQADQSGSDLIIVGRGGGSLEDLWAFNDEAVARAIFAANTPIISAVGHEVDFTIADFVADVRAPTPSAAAEIAVPVITELYDKLDGWRQRLRQAETKQLQRLRLQLERHSTRVQVPTRRLDRGRLELDELVTRLQIHMRGRFDQNRRTLGQIELQLNNLSPKAKLNRSRTTLQQLEQRLTMLMQSRIHSANQQLTKLSAALNALSPLAILERGFSLTFDEKQRLIRDAQTVSSGDRVRIRLHTGELTCKVLETKTTG